MANFLIYKASAGSGKTFALVRNFLGISFSASDRELPTRFSHILAITFTNKAATEMKERILRYLNEIICFGKDSAMAVAVSADLSLDVPEVQRRASIVLSSILHNYSDFSVCTIDSFMHRVVRTFAHDLNLPVNFNVRIDKEDIIQNAVDTLFSKVGTDNQDLTRMICAYMEDRMWNGKNTRLDEDIASLTSEIFSEDAPKYLSRLKDFDFSQFLQIQKELRTENKKYEAYVSSQAKRAMDAIRKLGLGPDDFYNKSKGGVYSFYEKLAESEMNVLSKPNANVRKCVDNQVFFSAAASQGKRSDIQSITPLLCEVFYKVFPDPNTSYRLYNTRNLMLDHLLSLAVMNSLHQIIQEYSDENEILHISEFNKRIFDVVENEPAPFIYERLGNRYFNFLIDEFQDTSRMQWHNLVPLLDNGVSQGCRSLVVGDAKQAIYRFRQGDVRQFVDLPKVSNSQHGKSLSAPNVSKEEFLPCNRRSGEVIVNFNNEFFDWTIATNYANHPDLQQIYAGQRQQSVKKGGYVAVNFEESDGINQRIYETIRHLVSENHYDYRDISIIAYTKMELSHISDFLAMQKIDDNPIPMVSAESFLLSNSRVVNVLRNAMACLLDPFDAIAIALVVENLRLMHRLPDDSLNYLSDCKSLPFSDTLKKLGGYDIDANRLLSESLYDCASQLVRIFNLQGIEAAYLGSFLNYINRYSKNNRQDMSDFLKAFDADFEKLSAATASDMNAVQLLTIHKAKGLESPVIIYPIHRRTEKVETLWVSVDEHSLGLPVGRMTFKKDAQTIFDDVRDREDKNSLMDKLNLFYVALTRPKEKLYLVVDDKENCFGPQLRAFSEAKPDLVNHFIGNDGFYSGEDAPKKVESDSENNNSSFDRNPQKVEMSNISFPVWQNRILIADQTSASFTSCMSDSVSEGIRLHEILSEVIVVGDQYQAVDHYVSKNNLSESERTNLLRRVEAFLLQSEVSQYFQPGLEVKTECSLVFEGRELRPDRLVFAPSAVHVIDFKTGMPLPQHEEQVSLYARAISSMGYENVETHIFYL